MSCLTTSATRRSRIVSAVVLTASAAASSHDVLLVPMTSITLYTLMSCCSFTAVPPAPGRDARRLSEILPPEAARPAGPAVSSQARRRHGSLVRSGGPGQTGRRQCHHRPGAFHQDGGRPARSAGRGGPGSPLWHRILRGVGSAADPAVRQ